MLLIMLTVQTQEKREKADLVYTGTVVEGMRVTGVVHETSNITGGI